MLNQAVTKEIKEDDCNFFTIVQSVELKRLNM